MRRKLADDLSYRTNVIYVVWCLAWVALFFIYVWYTQEPMDEKKVEVDSSRMSLF